MSKLTSVDFARLWEAIPKLSDKQWAALAARWDVVEEERKVKRQEKRKP